MDTEKLKAVYDAARALNSHNQDQAAKSVGKSKSTIYQVLDGKMTSMPTVKALLDYCYDAGLRHTIKEIGLDSNMKVGKSKNPSKVTQ